MTADLVKSFLNQAPNDLPFEVQFVRHMRKCRFLKSFDWDNYWLNVMFWFALTIQHTTEYGIAETLFKILPGFGFKIILFDRQNNCYVRNIFRKLEGAPRGLSEEDVEEFVYSRGIQKCALKEYLIDNKKITELKSFKWWKFEYPIEEYDNYLLDFTPATFSLCFQNSENRHQYSLDEPFKNFFRHHNSGTGTSQHFLSQMETLVDHLAQFWIQYRDHTYENYETVENHCSFLHGALLAFHSVTHLMPEVIHISMDILLINLKENKMNVNWLPTIISLSHSLTDEKRKEIMKQFSTRSGLYGTTGLVWPFKHYGITHSHSVTVNTAYNQNITGDLFQLDWILDDLDSIWPVNVQAPVDESGDICDWYYLSRYIAGLLCSSKIRSEIDVQYKIECFGDYQTSQFLLSATNGRRIILQIDEHVVPVNVTKIDEIAEHDKGIHIVKIHQYVDHDGVLRRNIQRLPSNLSENVESLQNFVELSKFIDLSLVEQYFHDQYFHLKVYDAIRNCFGSADRLLNGREEMKAFINGAFHYCNAISLKNDCSISKTLAVIREHKETKLLTFNFLSEEHENIFLPSHSMEIDQKIVNIVYKEPYSVQIVEVGIFSENEIELLSH